MAKFTYPSGDLDRRENLVALLGTHWNNVYRGNGVTESFLFARAQEEIQSYLDLIEAVATISRLTVPIERKERRGCLGRACGSLRLVPGRAGRGSVQDLGG